MYGIDADNAFNVNPDAPTMGVMMREFSQALTNSSSSNKPIDVTSIRQASAPISRPKKRARVTFADGNTDLSPDIPPPTGILNRSSTITTDN